jgi:hypothetical protein
MQGSRVLYAGSLRVRRDSRLELREGTTNLRIRRVEEGDAGDYDCEVCTLYTVKKRITIFPSAA